MKFQQSLSPKTFFLSQILILAFSLIFLGVIHYIVNIQYVKGNRYSLRGPVTTLPILLTLEVVSPDDNLLTFDSPYLISGKATPRTQVLISSETSDQVVQAKADGSFAVSFPLAEGPNEITIIAFDKVGEQRALTRTIYYSKEKI